MREGERIIAKKGDFKDERECDKTTEMESNVRFFAKFRRII